MAADENVSGSNGFPIHCTKSTCSLSELGQLDLVGHGQPSPDCRLWSSNEMQSRMAVFPGVCQACATMVADYEIRHNPSSERGDCW